MPQKISHRKSSHRPSPRSEGGLIDRQSDLDSLIDHLRTAPVIGVDTESDSFYSYSVKICLFQFSTPDDDYLVDPLAGLDLSGIGELMAEQGVQKVFHAGENDIGLLRHLHGFSFQNLFDSMIAAQVLGYPKCGLATLLETHFDVRMGKKYQTSDWRQRPLTSGQVAYAHADTHFLLPLRERLLEELEDVDRVEEAFSEFERVADFVWEPRPFDEQGFVRIKGARDLDAHGLSRLAAVYQLRDQLAKEANRAPYRVLTDEILMRLARHDPQSLDELSSLVRFTGRKLQKVGKAILSTLDHAHKQGPLSWPKRRRNRSSDGVEPLSDRGKRVLAQLRQWREGAARKRGVTIGRIATTAMLTQVAKECPRTESALAEIPGMAPWRLREYGEAILDVVDDVMTSR